MIRRPSAPSPHFLIPERSFNVPRGGHSRSGPPPDPTSFRSGAAGASGGWITLTTPTEPAPAWPLGEPTPAEAALWQELWTRPPASAWPQFHLTTDVAQYVRTSLAFEAGNYANAALGSLVMRMADQLGLTVGGAQRNRWLYPAPPRPERASVTPISGGHRSSRTASPACLPPPVLPPANPDDPRDGSATDSKGRHRSSRERFRQLKPPGEPA